MCLLNRDYTKGAQSTTLRKLGVKEKSYFIKISEEEFLNSTTQVKMIVPETKVEVLKLRDKMLDVELKVVGPFGELSKIIKFSYKPGYIIVQTDKPIYTPRENVMVRALVMGEDLRRINDPVDIDILTPDARVVARESCNASEVFCKSSLVLPPFPDTGIWTAKASLRGMAETFGTTPFEVREYVLPTFDVDVSIQATDKAILPSTKSITIAVDSTYVYGKKVKGSASLRLFVGHKGDLHSGSGSYVLDFISKTLQDGGTEFKVNIKEILKKLSSFPSGQYLGVEATVNELSSGKRETVMDVSTAFTKSPYLFKFDESRTSFRPDAYYTLKVGATHINGLPAPNINVSVTMIGSSEETFYILTDLDGNIQKEVSTPSPYKLLTFKVRSSLYGNDEKTLSVEAYKRSNNLEVEKVEILRRQRLVIHGKEIIERTIHNQKIEWLKHGYVPHEAPNEFRNGQHELRAYANNPGGSSGAFIMAVSRGQVVSISFKTINAKMTKQLEDNLMKALSPGGRALAFYVADGGVIADSAKFKVENVCMSKEVNISVKDGQGFKVEDKVHITINGPENGIVGLNIIDNALLLLNNEYILKPDTVFNVLSNHDLGCGIGGGTSEEEVFERAGLVLLTNAKFTNEGKHPCETENDKRWKRSTEPTCSYSSYGKEIEADECCCNDGVVDAEKVYDEYSEGGKSADIPVPLAVCYAIAKKRAKATALTVPMACIMAQYRKCIEALTELLDAGDDPEGRSTFLDRNSAYEDDIARIINATGKIRYRTDFRASLLFEKYELNSNGVKQLPAVKFPHSVTDWTIQAISYADDKGACVGKDVTVSMRKDFFVRLDLPYEAKRFETIYLKATIFNYVQRPKTVNVYLIGETGMCYGKKPGEPSEELSIHLEPYDARTITFPTIPIQAKVHDITVMAVEVGTSNYDSVKKKLFVENEGEEIRKKIVVCLDPNELGKDCQNDKEVINVVTSRTGKKNKVALDVDLSPSADALIGTGTATAYLESSPFDTVRVSGVKEMFRKPGGCAEQNMAKLAPTVYSLIYLRQTGNIRMSIEREGVSLIKKGIDHQMTQRSSDYSYYFAKSREVWLTAYVAKVYCQAQKAVPSGTYLSTLPKTLDFIANQQKSDGSFSSEVTYTNKYAWTVDGSTTKCMTAYVLITLQECPRRTKKIKQVISRATSYVEGNRQASKDSKFLTAISAYALALSDSTHKETLKQKLIDTATIRGEMMYWSQNHISSMLETAAYALLTFLKFDDMNRSDRIARWITSQRTPYGFYGSTQTNVMVLQALTEYSIRTYQPDIDLDVTLTKDGYKASHTLTHDNIEHQKIFPNLPVESVGKILHVEVTGIGHGRMVLDLRYNVPHTKVDMCPFQINITSPSDVIEYEAGFTVNSTRVCDVCGRCNDSNETDCEAGKEDEGNGEQNSRIGRRKRDTDAVTKPQERWKCMRINVRLKPGEADAGMSIIKVNLETGVTVKEEDLKAIKESDPNISLYEMPSTGRGYIALYLDTITTEPTSLIFRLVDDFQGDLKTRQMSSVEVYDYYTPERHCQEYYSIGPNHGKTAVEYDCSDDKTQCDCVLNTCANAVENEIVAAVHARLRDRRAVKPVDLIYNYMCESSNADYEVKILEVEQNKERREMTAIGNVQEQIKKGYGVYTNVSENITFVWQLGCSFPELQVDKVYMISGLERVYTTEPRYSLMQPALVIDPNREDLSGKDRRFLNTVLKRLKEKFKDKKGCST